MSLPSQGIVLEYATDGTNWVEMARYNTTNFYAWTQEQGALLRDRKTKALDYVNLAEEVESLGKSQQHALESRLEKLVLHLLKWHYQPEKRLRGQSWQRTILEQRRRIRFDPIAGDDSVREVGTRSVSIDRART